MHIEFECQKCQKKLRVPEGQEGKKLKCPGCESLVRVPRHGNADESKDFTSSRSTRTLRNPASIRHAKREMIRDSADSWQTIEVETLPEAIVVTFTHGDLRGQVFESRLEKELRELCELIPDNFLDIDFAAITYVPSRVLSILIAVSKTLSERNISVRFYGMNKSVQNTMEMVGLGEIASFYPNRAIALKEIVESQKKNTTVRLKKQPTTGKTVVQKQAQGNRPMQIKILILLGALALLATGILIFAYRSPPESVIESE